MKAYIEALIERMISVNYESGQTLAVVTSLARGGMKQADSNCVPAAFKDHSSSFGHYKSGETAI